MTSRGLDDVLVVTVRKSYWASCEAEAFPRRLYEWILCGRSTNLLNSVVITARALVVVMATRPKVVVLGSVERAVPWFIRLRRLGLLWGARLVVTNQLHLDDEQLAQVDRVLLYSRAVIDRQRPELRKRAVFVPLPANGDFESARRSFRDGDYVFTGGIAGRDFASLIEALRDTGVPLEVVTYSAETLGYQGDLPPNCRVLWGLTLSKFLARAAGSLLVAVPLRDPESDFGQTTVVQALSLGKAIVATRCPSLQDYVEDGKEGLLVEAGDILAYRDAVLRLAGDIELRRACERHARERAASLSYARFGSRLGTICRELVQTV